jgi:hypothetical protein
MRQRPRRLIFHASGGMLVFAISFLGTALPIGAMALVILMAPGTELAASLPLVIFLILGPAAAGWAGASRRQPGAVPLALLGWFSANLVLVPFWGAAWAEGLAYTIAATCLGPPAAVLAWVVAIVRRTRRTAAPPALPLQPASQVLRVRSRPVRPGERESLEVRRKYQPWLHHPGRLEVCLDDTRIGNLAQGESVTVFVSPGIHLLLVRLGQATATGVASIETAPLRTQAVLVSMGDAGDSWWRGLASLAASLVAEVISGISTAGPSSYRFEDAATAEPGQRSGAPLLLVVVPLIGVAVALAFAADVGVGLAATGLLALAAGGYGLLVRLRRRQRAEVGVVTRSRRPERGQ